MMSQLGNSLFVAHRREEFDGNEEMDIFTASSGDEEDVHFIQNDREPELEEGAQELHASHHRRKAGDHSFMRRNHNLAFISIMASTAAIAAVISIAHVPSIMTVIFQGKEEEVRGFTKKAPASSIIDQLRFDIATVSIEMMQNDTIEEAKQSHFVDISPFVDLVEEALDTVGMRGVYVELFESRSFAETVTTAARAKGLLNFYVEVDHKPDKQPSFKYTGIPNNRTFAVDATLCTGCLWWLRHWVGAITADKLVRDGSLLLDTFDESPRRLYDAASIMKELQRIASPRASTETTHKLHHPDILPIHAMHGFVWHYVTITRPDLDDFPLDIAQDLCGDLLWEDEYVADLSTGVGIDCRHAFGHAVFYTLAVKEIGPKNFSVRKQFRPAGGFVLSEDSMCKGYEICKGAPNEKTHQQCKGGIRHSYRIVGLQDTSDEAEQAVAEQENRCRKRDGNTTDDGE
jgi:hypothetical protein